MDPQLKRSEDGGATAGKSALPAGGLEATEHVFRLETRRVADREHERFLELANKNRRDSGSSPRGPASTKNNAYSVVFACAERDNESLTTIQTYMSMITLKQQSATASLLSIFD